METSGQGGTSAEDVAALAAARPAIDQFAELSTATRMGSPGSMGAGFAPGLGAIEETAATLEAIDAVLSLATAGVRLPSLRVLRQAAQLASLASFAGGGPNQTPDLLAALPAAELGPALAALQGPGTASPTGE